MSRIVNMKKEYQICPICNQPNHNAPVGTRSIPYHIKCIQESKKQEDFNHEYSIVEFHRYLKETYGYKKSLQAALRNAKNAGVYKAHKGLLCEPAEAVKAIDEYFIKSWK